MHHTSLTAWAHDHTRLRVDRQSGEKRTLIVVVITALMMLLEITAGSLVNSMALFADGWHMATHVTAFVIAAVAYRFARTRSSDSRFAFGTGKIEVLGGFVSAIILSGIAVFMAVQAVSRLMVPGPILFDDAIPIAALGLLVNISCALVLKDSPHHGHSHSHSDDLNRRAAYIHVLADALTSVTALAALVLGKLFGWIWLDPAMGLVGVAVILSWAWGLIREASGILLDITPGSTDLPTVIRENIEDGDARISDLHVWQIGSGRFAAVVSVVADHPKTTLEYRELLGQHEELVHVTVEIHRCESHHQHETDLKQSVATVLPVTALNKGNGAGHL